MKNLTIVCARVTRDVNGCIKDKIERYLVVHEENKDASELLRSCLRPFSTEELVIQYSALQKGYSIIEKGEGSDIWKAQVRYTRLVEKRNGSLVENWESEKLFLRGDNYTEAYQILANYLGESMLSTDDIVSLSRVNITDVI